MTTIRIEPTLLEVMRELKDQEGIPMAVQVDKALREWLERRGLKVKPAPRRAATRRKA